MNFSKNSYERCKESALRIIERGHKAEREMEQRLLRKGYDTADIKKVILFLKEYKFLDDKSYVEMYVKDRLKKQGTKKIKYDLVRKGVDKGLIEDEINDISDEELQDCALKVGRKKYGQLIKREMDQYLIKNKLYAYLLSRGYEYSIVQKVTKELMK